MFHVNSVQIAEFDRLPGRHISYIFVIKIKILPKNNKEDDAKPLHT